MIPCWASAQSNSEDWLRCEANEPQRRRDGVLLGWNPPTLEFGDDSRESADADAVIIHKTEVSARHMCRREEDNITSFVFSDRWSAQTSVLFNTFYSIFRNSTEHV